MEENVYDAVLNQLWSREAKAAGMVKEAGDMTRDKLMSWSAKELNAVAKDFRAREKHIFELEKVIATHLASLSDSTKKQAKDADTIAVIQELTSLLRKVQDWVLGPMVEVCEAVQNRQMELLEQFAR